MEPIPLSHPIIDRARSTVLRNNMIPRDSGIVVAVSGGPDSMALVHVLHALRREFPCRITAAHLDHGLRAESAEESRFVVDMCGSLGVPTITERVEVRDRAEKWGISIEEAGRRARYGFFESVRLSAGAEVIATAHHKDDALETFFLRILRGSSLSGLGGIPPVRGRVVRPFVEITRAEIMDFVEQKEIPHVTDPTNLLADTDRNFVRNRILPVIEERFPGFRAPLERTVALIAQDQDFLDRSADELRDLTVHETDDGPQLAIPPLARAHPALSSRVLVKALYAISGPHIRWNRKHVESIVDLIQSDNPSGSIDLPAGIRAVREYDRLSLSVGPCSQPARPFRYVVSGPGMVKIPEAEMTLCFQFCRRGPHFPPEIGAVSKAYFDASELPFPLIVRSPEPGDRFRPWGMEGTRKLKDFFIDAKVPVRKRSSSVLLAREDEILWVVGHRRAAKAPVLDHTERVLEVSIL